MKTFLIAFNKIANAIFNSQNRQFWPVRWSLYSSNPCGITLSCGQLNLTKIIAVIISLQCTLYSLHAFRQAHTQFQLLIVSEFSVAHFTLCCTNTQLTLSLLAFSLPSGSQHFYEWLPHKNTWPPCLKYQH